MAKVVFPFHVLYGGLLRPPLKPFDVPDIEVSKLVKQGAKAISSAPQEKAKVSSNLNAKQPVTQKKR